MGKFELRPCEFKEACAFVTQHHRHHRPPQGHRFSLKALRDGKVVGVAIVGRPVARNSQDGFTLELTRLCTNGTRNACTFLIGRVKRVGRALGYKRLISFTLEEEPGAAWRAAGMEQTGIVKGQPWRYSGAPLFWPIFDSKATRRNAHLLVDKRKWEIEL